MKNQIWKLLFILAIIIISVGYVVPLGEKLKPGLDLGGGVSLLYDIDTEGLTTDETKGLALRMIPILRRRVDPTNVANINMIPHGNTRIEIQLPLASQETIQKRGAYEEALQELESENINVLKIRSALSKEDVDLEDVVNKFAGDPEKRKEIASKLEEKKKQLDKNKIQEELEAEIEELENILDAYDKRKEILTTWAKVNKERSNLQDQRNQLNKKMSEVMSKLEEAGVENIEEKAPEWNNLDSEEQQEKIKEYANNDSKKITLINAYMSLFEEKAPIVNQLTRPETGLNAQYQEASQKLADLNLGQSRVMDTLAITSEAKRQEKIEALIKAFPDRKEKIVSAIKAYDTYRKVGGRLDDPEDLKRMLKGAGVLEFRILPLKGGEKSNITELTALENDLQEKGPKQASTSDYIWLEIEEPKNFDPRYESGTAVVGTFGDKSYVLASNKRGETMLQGKGEEAWKMRKAMPTVDSRTGKRAVAFRNDKIASVLFFKLTKANQDRPLCIILDNQAISAPVLQSAISDEGIITGDFSQQEIDDMVNKLNAGSFPARLSDVPISEKTIGATIGAENRDKGVQAGKYGLIAVAVFMIFYYLLAGVMAVIALCMNLLFILALMVMFDATFTLPGIAGLILTIGMSVDANVLIFERIREELNLGNSLRSSIANGYQRAFRTIFDANITTFFVALILYMVASEEIKGFAIILMLGIASSMFTALFATRVFFDTMLDLKLLKNKLPMQSLIGKPNINWMSGRAIFWTISIALIIGGLSVFILRDESKDSKWDIEFTGGTRLTVDFISDKSINEEWVRKRIRSKGEELNNSALAAAKVYSVGKEDNRQFEITTTATNKTTADVTFNEAGKTEEEVQTAIQKAAKDTGTLYNLQVSKTGEKTFEVSTSQVNKSLVRKVLAKAFEDKAEISEPVVNELVSNAVRDAFEKYLKTKKDLEATILSADEIKETSADLPDYAGGVKITTMLAKETTYKDLKERFEAILSKGDMRELERYSHEILSADMTKPDNDKVLDKFVYVSVHPEAGYRKLSMDEWDNFVENERTKIEAATSLETTLSRVTQIDPSIGKEAMYSALVAIILSLIVIVAYIWIRFGTANFGFAAILALVHDVCIVLGIITACTYIAPTKIGEALLIQDFKIDLAIIAAFLTIIGYSLNDTIVVFDRIRENRGKQTNLTKDLINESINQTLSRTLLTSFTTFLVVLIMYIWGGSGLRGFTFAMLIGIIVGTYSSIAIASPILLIGSKDKSKDSA